jgi:hypothetical protein
MLGATVDWRLLLASAILFALALILAYRLFSRDPNVRRTRVGFFVERTRFEDEPPWPELDPHGETKEYKTGKMREIPPGDT